MIGVALRASALSRPVVRPTARTGAPTVAFGLFLALSAILILRPTEIVESLDGAPIFQAVILACLTITFPWVLVQLTPSAIAVRPITACVLGVAVAIPLSLIGNSGVQAAVESGADFLKVVAYYLLLVAVVDSPRRFKILAGWLLACLALHSALALLNFHGVIDIPAMSPVYDMHTRPDTGETISVVRMCGVGLFGNPNDLSRVLAVGIALAVYVIGESPLLLAPGYAGLIGMFGYAITQTHSRGGLLALVVSGVAYLQIRFGGIRTLVLVAIALPSGMALLSGGRQADLSMEQGTGQQRTQLWVEGFVGLRESPLFGLGADRYSELTGGLGAHNAYVECYVELGVFGGTCFISAVILALWQTYKLRPARVPRLSQSLARMQPIVLAVVAGYAAGMLSSSRNYVMPTYLVLGMATVYQRLAAAAAPRLAPRLNGPMLVTLFAVSALVIVCMYAFAIVTVRWS